MKILKTNIGVKSVNFWKKRSIPYFKYFYVIIIKPNYFFPLRSPTVTYMRFTNTQIETLDNKIHYGINAESFV